MTEGGEEKDEGGGEAKELLLNMMASTCNTHRWGSLLRPFPPPFASPEKDIDSLVGLSPPSPSSYSIP